MNRTRKSIIPRTLFACLIAALPMTGSGSILESFPLIHTDPSVRELDLDDRLVFTIPVGIDRVTTISFPGPISAIDAALVTVDGKTPGLFQLAHKQGTYFFSVRALAKNAMTNVNVRWNKRTYVIELQESRNPLLSVIFKAEANASFPKPHEVGAVTVTPAILLGLLDKAKAFPVLQPSHPEAFAGVDHRDDSSRPEVTEGHGYEIRLEEVFRFNPQDTLVFRLTLRNKTDHPIRYAPEGFAVRVGERFYTQSISDASGIMPPKSDSPAYFAITGTPDGGRNDLSLKNHFMIVLTDAAIEHAAQSVPINDPTPLPPSSPSKGGFSK